MPDNSKASRFYWETQKHTQYSTNPENQNPTITRTERIAIFDRHGGEGAHIASTELFNVVLAEAIVEGLNWAAAQGKI